MSTGPVLNRSDSNDDSELLIRALKVNDTGEDYDINVPPTSGNEYLRRVQYEARRCPQVVVADLDTSRFKSHQTVVVSNSTGCQPPPRGYAPSIQWQKEQISSFSALRINLAAYKARANRETPSVKLPIRENYVDWCKFCFGSVDDNNEGSLPLLSIVTSMSQALIVQVLEYHVNWFEVKGFSENQGRWFYALLAALEKPLIPEACSLLRQLARYCANLRATLVSNEDSHLAPLNLLICLVARYFNQGDLADNTEDG